MNKKLGLMVGAAVLAMSAQSAMADCKSLASAGADWSGVKSAADYAMSRRAAGSSPSWDGFGANLGMWVTVVDETGTVCAVYNTSNGGDKDNNGNSNASWLASRVISAQKANTANSLSTDGLSLSTGVLYTLVMEGGSLYGLQASNPVDASRAYGGSPNSYGTNADYLKNKRIGGVNVFGGGLALYNSSHVKVGAVGVSGNTSCADHSFAWIVRDQLGLDYSPGGSEYMDLGNTHPWCGAGEKAGDAGLIDEDIDVIIRPTTDVHPTDVPV